MKEIAEAHRKSPAQVLLRHLTQSGIIAIPKSVKQHRIKENFDIHDFELTNEEMGRMDKLDKGSKSRYCSWSFAYVMQFS